MKRSLEEKNSIDVPNHKLTRITYTRLEDFLRSTHQEMKKAGLRDEFRSESENCFRAIIIFYDLAMKSPRSAEMVMEKFKTRELLSDRDPDELKLSLLEATKFITERETLYQGKRDFAMRMALLCSRTISIVEEAIEQKLQQEQNPLKSILKQPSASAERATGKSVSWADRVATDEGRK